MTKFKLRSFSDLPGQWTHNYFFSLLVTYFLSFLKERLLRFWSITTDSHCLFLVKHPCLRIKHTEQEAITRLSMFRQLNSTCIASLVFCTFYMDCKASVHPSKSDVDTSAFLKSRCTFWIRLAVRCVMFLYSQFTRYFEQFSISAAACWCCICDIEWMLISMGQYKILVLESKFIVKHEHNFCICFYKCICPVKVLGKLFCYLIVKSLCSCSLAVRVPYILVCCFADPVTFEIYILLVLETLRLSLFFCLIS